MLLLFFALLLAVLANANYRLSGSLLYPPTLLCSVWTILLLVLVATGDIFFPISFETLTVYVVGAAAFSVGAILATHFIPLEDVRRREFRRPKAFVLTGGLILLLVVLPLYWDYLQTIASPWSGDDFWRSLRAEMLDRADDWSSKTLSDLVLEGFSMLATLLAVTAVVENDGSRFSRIRMILMIVTALVYALMMSSSSWAVTLALALIGVDAIRKRRLDTKMLSIGAGVAIASFAVIAILVGKGKTGVDATLGENLLRCGGTCRSLPGGRRGRFRCGGAIPDEYSSRMEYLAGFSIDGEQIRGGLRCTGSARPVHQHLERLRQQRLHHLLRLLSGLRAGGRVHSHARAGSGPDVDLSDGDARLCAFDAALRVRLRRNRTHRV